MENVLRRRIAAALDEADELEHKRDQAEHEKWREQERKQLEEDRQEQKHLQARTLQNLERIAYAFERIAENLQYLRR